MEFKVEGFCVDPKRIEEYWPAARQLIRTAIEHENLSDFYLIEKEVLEGDQLLWIAHCNGIEAAATTRLSRNVCTIVACSGHHMERWQHLLGLIESYARAEKCKCVRLYGRKGWERVLKDYRVEHVVMEKVI